MSLIIIGRYRGLAQPTPAPPLRDQIHLFSYTFSPNSPRVGGSYLSERVHSPAPQREILDPPLIMFTKVTIMVLGKFT